MLFNSIIAAAILAYTAVAVLTMLAKAMSTGIATYAPAKNSTSSSGPPTKSITPDALTQILLAPLATDRFTVLSESDNFGAGDLKKNQGAGGELAAANRKTFQALIGSGSGMA
jgi:hypothetical protein